jgi:hypothetical protein
MASDQCSLKGAWCFGGSRSSSAFRLLVSCFAYSFTMEKEAICSSERSVDFHRTTWRYIPDDRNLNLDSVVKGISGSQRNL